MISFRGQAPIKPEGFQGVARAMVALKRMQR
jgi:hypothetical protein